MPELTAEQWRDKLHKRLLARQAAMSLHEDYYQGRHRATFILARLLEAFGKDFRDLRINYCSVVVDALNERLAVDGFLLGNDNRATAAAWEIWQRSRLDDEFSRGTRSGLVKSEFALLVWPDAAGEPRITVEDGAQVIVATNPADRRDRRAALKRWYDEDDRRLYATLYLPDGIYKYRSAESSRDAALPAAGLLPAEFYRGDAAGAASSASQPIAWERRIVDGEPWPISNPFATVPVVTLPNRPDIAGVGTSELAQIIPIQDAINANLVNVMLAGQFGAFRQKWATNVKLKRDASGKVEEPWQVAIDSIFTAPPPEPGEPEVKFGEFSETSLDGYVKLHEAYVQGIATISRTPPHYFLGSSGVWPSGESLRSAETGLTRKATERASDFGDPVEEIMQLAFRMKATMPTNSTAARERYLRWAAAPLRTHWMDPETRTESAHIDALQKMLALGVPQEAIWARIPATPQEIEQWKLMRPAPPMPAGSEVADGDQ